MNKLCAARISNFKPSSKAFNLIFAFLILFQSNSYASIVMIGQKVKAANGTECSAFLFKEETATPKNLVLQMRGSGIYSNANRKAIRSELNSLVDQGKIAVVVFEKPGLRADPISLDRGAIMDFEIYSSLTPKVLMNCGEASLIWASDLLKSQNIFIRGHSEGASVSIDIASELVAKKSTLLKSLKSLFLSGIPMNFKDGLEVQFKTGLIDKTKFWKAIETCDNKYLLGGVEVPCGYIKEIFSSITTQKVLSNLSLKSPTFKFNIYHGNFDINTPVDLVLNFEKENEKRSNKGQSFLNWEGRYYAADHSLNMTAMKDMERDLAKELGE